MEVEGRGVNEIGPRYLSKRVLQRGYGLHGYGGSPLIVVQGGGIGNFLAKTSSFLYPYLSAFLSDMKEQAITSGKRQLKSIGSRAIAKLGSGVKKRKKKRKKPTKRSVKKPHKVIRLKEFGEYPLLGDSKPKKKRKVKKNVKAQAPQLFS